MAINAINGAATSGLSAVDGKTLSTLSAINGQTITAAFTPSSLASIWDWWEPNLQGGLVNNDPISTLTGQANARNFTNAVGGTQILYDTTDALNGLAIGNFATGTKQLLGPDMSAITTAAHVFYLVRVVVQAGTNGIWLMGNGPAVYAFAGDGHIYESAFRTNDRPDMGLPVLALTLWNIFEVKSQSNDWRVFINGTQQGSTQNPNTVGGLASPIIGHDGVVTGKGYFAGLYVCSAALGSTDRSNLINYIVTRFNLAGETAFFLTYVTTTPRSDFSGEIGVTFTALTDGISVTQLARWKISGNSQTHTLRLRRVSDNAVLASGSFNASGGTTGALNYVSVTPVALTAGAAYRVTSSETNGGDQWYDAGAATYQGIVSAEALCFSSDGTTWNTGSSDENWGPVDFKYQRSFT